MTFGHKCTVVEVYRGTQVRSRRQGWARSSGAAIRVLMPWRDSGLPKWLEAALHPWTGLERVSEPRVGIVPVGTTAPFDEQTGSEWADGCHLAPVAGRSSRTIDDPTAELHDEALLAKVAILLLAGWRPGRAGRRPRTHLRVEPRDPVAQPNRRIYPCLMIDGEPFRPSGTETSTLDEHLVVRGVTKGLCWILGGGALSGLGSSIFTSRLVAGEEHRHRRRFNGNSVSSRSRSTGSARTALLRADARREEEALPSHRRRRAVTEMFATRSRGLPPRATEGGLRLSRASPKPGRCLVSSIRTHHERGSGRLY